VNAQQNAAANSSRGVTGLRVPNSDRADKGSNWEGKQSIWETEG